MEASSSRLVGRVLVELPPDARRQFAHHVTTGAVHAELAERCLTPRGRGTETLEELRGYLQIATRELNAALAILPTDGDD